MNFKKVIVLFLVILIACCGCSKKQKIEYKETMIQTNSNKLGWWIKRVPNHNTPEASTEVDLAKYHAYYVDTKKKNKKVMYLTFDCGYENGYTGKILDVLKKEKVPAAFFLTQTYIRDNIKLVKRMKQEGHMIGNHTVHHKSMPTISERNQKEEIIDCAEYCKKATGYDMDMIYRPPMGEYNELNLQIAKELGYQTVFWSIAYLDYDVTKQPRVDYVIEHFKENYHNGAIPLLHNVSSSNTQALETVIKFLKSKHYKFLSLKSLSKY